MSAPELRPGTVVEYQSERPNGWCREGMAIADDRGRLVDTYWESAGDSHFLTDAEIATAKTLFNLNDCIELPRGSERTWESYALEDRHVVTSQHGLRRRLFVRTGAEPHLPTQIENARAAVEKAERDLESAQRQLGWKRDDLAKLEEQA
jgi:hypothetical protein